MKKQLYLFLILSCIGCKTKEINNQRILKLDDKLGEYYVAKKSDFSKIIQKKQEEFYFSSELSDSFDQNAVVKNININNIAKILSEELKLTSLSLGKDRIMLNIVFRNDGKPQALSYLVPLNFELSGNNLKKMEDKIKSTITAEIDMHSGRQFVMYSMFITSKTLESLK